MTTVTIPKKLTGSEELIVVSRKRYQELLRVYKKASKRSQVDQRLEKAFADIRAGRVSGPFRSAKSLMKSLEK